MSSAAMPQLWRRDATVISIVGFAHATSHFFHLMLPPLFPWLMKEYSLSYTQIGALTSVFYAVSGVGQAFAGFLVDRWGAHRVLSLGVTLLACSGLLVAATPGLWGLYLAAFVAGLGNCVFHPADFSLLNSRVSQARLGHAFSVHGLSGNVGWAAGPLLMTATATAFGWRVAGLTAAFTGTASLAALWWKRGDLADGGPVHRSSRTQAPNSTLRQLVKLKLTWFAFAFFFFTTLGFGALQNFAPSLLGDLYGLSLAAGTSALTAYLVGGGAGLATGGFLANASRRQERLVGFSFFCSAAFALLLSLQVVPGWSVAGIMALMGFGVGIAGPSRDMLLRKAAAARLGTGSFGRIYGLVYSGLDVGLATAPLIFGMLLDSGHAALVFAGVSVSLVIAIAAAQALAAEARE